MIRYVSGIDPQPASSPGETPVLAGMAVYLGLLTAARGQDLLPSPERLVLIMLGAAVMGLILLPRVRPHAPVLVTVLILGAGLFLRWVEVSHPGGSDVLSVTHEALSVTLGAGNPYDHFYTSSRPPGAPFPYPPVNLLIHLPGHLLAGLDGVRMTEFVAAWIVMVLIARVALQDGHPLAIPMLALYAMLPNLVNLVGDGSNDTSAGAVFVLFMLALVRADGKDRWRAVLAGVLAACAIGTKQSALPLMVAGSAWLLHASRPQFRRYAVAAATTLLLVSVPFVLQAGVVGYVRALTAFAGFHEDVYGWNIWVLAQQLRWPVASREDALVLGTIVGLAALVVVAVPRYRLARTALAAGAVAMAVLFLAQRWTAYSYFAQLLSVLVILPLLRPRDVVPGDRLGPPGGQGEPAVPSPQNATKSIEMAQTAYAHRAIEATAAVRIRPVHPRATTVARMANSSTWKSRLNR